MLADLRTFVFIMRQHGAHCRQERGMQEFCRALSLLPEHHMLVELVFVCAVLYGIHELHVDSEH